MTVEVVGGTSGPVTLDADMIIVDRIEDLGATSTSKSIKVVASKEGYATTTTIYSLANIVFDE